MEWSQMSFFFFSSLTTFFLHQCCSAGIQLVKNDINNRLDMIFLDTELLNLRLKIDISRKSLKTDYYKYSIYLCKM